MCSPTDDTCDRRDILKIMLDRQREDPSCSKGEQSIVNVKYSLSPLKEKYRKKFKDLNNIREKSIALFLLGSQSGTAHDGWKDGGGKVAS